MCIRVRVSSRTGEKKKNEKNFVHKCSTRDIRYYYPTTDVHIVRETFFNETDGIHKKFRDLTPRVIISLNV